jgi:hydroxypyruvate isomerase
VNCSILFTELPLCQRPAAAKAASFDAVEFWWPFAEAVPPETEVARFVSTLREAGVSLVSLNASAGDLAAGDRGLVSWPGREREFAASVDVLTGIAEATGTRLFNTLYGNRLNEVDPAEQDELAARNLTLAAEAIGRLGGTVLIEPVSDVATYPLRTAADAVAVLQRAHQAGAHNVGLLADLYHLAANGDDVEAAIANYAGWIRHVQIADHPGRHQPGTGELPLRRYLAELAAVGYGGWVACEYRPAGASAASFDWVKEVTG